MGEAILILQLGEGGILNVQRTGFSFSASHLPDTDKPDVKRLLPGRTLPENKQPRVLLLLGYSFCHHG